MNTMTNLVDGNETVSGLGDMGSMVANETTAKRGKPGKSTVVLDLKDRDTVRFGKTYEAKAAVGHHAIVTPGASIVLIGEIAPGQRYVTSPEGKREVNAAPIVYRRSFKVGDSAEYGSYNMCYFGTIISIGPKTVAIAHPHSRRVTRLSLSEFSWRNRDDAEEKHARNASWSD